MTLTIQQVLDLSPCDPYNEAYLTQLFNGASSLDADGFLALGIPDQDKLWIMVRPELLDQATLDASNAQFLTLIPQDSPYWSAANAADYNNAMWYILAYVQMQGRDGGVTATQMVNILMQFSPFPPPKNRVLSSMISKISKIFSK